MDQIISSNTQDFEEMMDKCNDPFDAWGGKIARKELTDQTILWILGLADWKVSVTLTFRNEKPYDVAIAYFKGLVRDLNIEIFGKRYTNIVKHSYFSYALGIEYQIRDVIHFHVIIDKPVNFSKIHTLWNYKAGFAWTDIIRSKEDCVSYISKYNLKGGQVEVYKAKKDYYPKVLPIWWKDFGNNQKELFETRPGLLSDREIGSHPGQH